MVAVSAGDAKSLDDFRQSEVGDGFIVGTRISEQARARRCPVGFPYAPMIGGGALRREQDLAAEEREIWDFVVAAEDRMSCDAGVADAADFRRAGDSPIRLPQFEMARRAFVVDSQKQNLVLVDREIWVGDAAEQATVQRGLRILDLRTAVPTDFDRPAGGAVGSP